MNTHDGGPAFPMIWDATHEQNWKTEAGMSLRDYFAAKAMVVVLAQCTEPPDHTWRVGVAMDAYKMADAMLAARSDEK